MEPSRVGEQDIVASQSTAGDVPLGHVKEYMPRVDIGDKGRPKGLLKPCVDTRNGDKVHARHGAHAKVHSGHLSKDMPKETTVRG